MRLKSSPTTVPVVRAITSTSAGTPEPIKANTPISSQSRAKGNFPGDRDVTALYIGSVSYDLSIPIRQAGSTQRRGHMAFYLRGTGGVHGIRRRVHAPVGFGSFHYQLEASARRYSSSQSNAVAGRIRPLPAK